MADQSLLDVRSRASFYPPAMTLFRRSNFADTRNRSIVVLVLLVGISALCCCTEEPWTLKGLFAPRRRYLTRYNEKRQLNPRNPVHAAPAFGLEAELAEWESLFAIKRANTYSDSDPDTHEDQLLQEVVVHRLDLNQSDLTPVLRMLSSPRILQTLAGYLHHLDLANLCTASGKLRAAIIAHSPDFSLEQTRFRTCDTGTKGECWSCGIQICAVCLAHDLFALYLLSSFHFSTLATIAGFFNQTSFRQLTSPYRPASKSPPSAHCRVRPNILNTASRYAQTAITKLAAATHAARPPAALNPAGASRSFLRGLTTAAQSAADARPFRPGMPSW